MASGAHEPMEEEGQVDNGNKEVPKENEDPVVCEIPVKFSKKLIEKLFLLQYPMRPRQRPYSSDLRRLNARIKPLQRKMEIQYEIDPASSCYDSRNPTQLQRFKISSSLMRNKANYAAGVFCNGELHITPLKNMVRMRPDFSYIDQAEKKKRDELEEAKRRAMGQTKKEELRQVTEQIARRGAPAHTRARQKLNLKRLTELVSKEPWCELAVFPDDSLESQLHRADLAPSVRGRGGETSAEVIPSRMEFGGNSIGGGAGAFGLRKEAYLAHVIDVCKSRPESQKTSITGPRVEAANEERKGGNPEDKERLFGLKVQQLMMQAKVASFKEVCSHIGVRTQKEVALVLEYLLKIGFVVQGVWVQRSGLKKLPRREAFARNYLMAVFSRIRTVKRADVIQVMRLGLEPTSRLLQELGVSNGGGIWEFRKPTDEKFLAKYPHIVSEHKKKLAELEIKMKSKLLKDVT